MSEVVTSKLLSPLIKGMGGITATIKKVPTSHEKTNAPALHQIKTDYPMFERQKTQIWREEHMLALSLSLLP